MKIFFLESKREVTCFLLFDVGYIITYPTSNSKTLVVQLGINQVFANYIT